jgi:hypothetical protein
MVLASNVECGVHDFFLLLCWAAGVAGAAKRGRNNGRPRAMPDFSSSLSDLINDSVFDYWLISKPFL